MTLLITAEEIIQKTGIRKGTDTGLINLHLIDAVQEEWIRPVLGVDLYNLIVAEAEACVYTNLNKTLHDDYIKPLLAHYVWSQVLPQLHVQTTNSGIQINNSEFANSPSNQQRADLSDSVNGIASSLCEKMIRYLDTNEASFADWTCGTGIKNNISKTGGIILPKK
jgi:hypothetical protein